VNKDGKVKILCVEKVMNCILYDKFTNEMKRMLRKYPNKKLKDIMQYLFHGSRETDPTLIH
jgi:hypothetical protein